MDLDDMPGDPVATSRWRWWLMLRVYWAGADGRANLAVVPWVRQ